MRWKRHLPPLASVPVARPLVRLQRWQVPVVIVVGGALAMTLAVPVASLVERLGTTAGGGWSWQVAVEYLRQARTAHGPTVIRTIVVGVAGGFVASALAVLVCWSAQRDRAVGVGLLVVTALLWATPGPVIGVALGQAIRWGAWNRTGAGMQG